MSRKRIKDATVTVSQRVIVKQHMTSWYAEVDGELRYSTTKGPNGISEWRNFDWFEHVGKQHHFTRAQFRQWVIEHIEGQEHVPAGICETPAGAEGETCGEDIAAPEARENHESATQNEASNA